MLTQNWHKVQWDRAETHSPQPQLGHSQPLGCISRLGSLMWGLGPSQQCTEFFDIIVLQFVGCPPSGYRIWFYSDCTPPTVLLWLLLCPWIWGIFQTNSPLRAGPHGEETMLPAHVRGWQLGWRRSHCQASTPNRYAQCVSQAGLPASSSRNRSVAEAVPGRHLAPET